MEKETRTVRKNMLRDHSSWHITPPSGLAREGPRCAHLRSHHVSPFCLALAVSKAGFFFDLKSGHNTAAVSWTFKVPTAVAVALSVSLSLLISLLLSISSRGSSMNGCILESSGIASLSLPWPLQQSVKLLCTPKVDQYPISSYALFSFAGIMFFMR